jgi:transcriptional regulator with XRE-family HTH domain
MKAKRSKQSSVTKAEWFRAMLKQKHISQRRLAMEMGIDPAAMSRILHGTRKLQLGEAKQIAGILGVQLSDVLLAAGIQTSTRLESGGLQEALRRLMEHSNAHMMECMRRGDMATAETVMSDIRTAMTLLDTMITGSRTNALQ